MLPAEIVQEILALSGMARPASTPDAVQWPGPTPEPAPTPGLPSPAPAPAPTPTPIVPGLQRIDAGPSEREVEFARLAAHNKERSAEILAQQMLDDLLSQSQAAPENVFVGRGNDIRRGTGERFEQTQGTFARESPEQAARREKNLAPSMERIMMQLADEAPELFTKLQIEMAKGQEGSRPLEQLTDLIKASNTPASLEQLLTLIHAFQQSKDPVMAMAMLQKLAEGK